MTASPSGCCLHQVAAVFLPELCHPGYRRSYGRRVSPWSGPFQMIVGRGKLAAGTWAWRSSPEAPRKDVERQDNALSCHMVWFCGGPATRGAENAYRGGCTADTTTGGRPMSHVRRFDHVGLTVADL